MTVGLPAARQLRNIPPLAWKVAPIDKLSVVLVGAGILLLALKR